MIYKVAGLLGKVFAIFFFQFDSCSRPNGCLYLTVFLALNVRLLLVSRPIFSLRIIECFLCGLKTRIVVICVFISLTSLKSRLLGGKFMLCSRVLCFLAERGRVQLAVDVRQFRCVLSVCHGTGHLTAVRFNRFFFPSMELFD